MDPNSDTLSADTIAALSKTVMGTAEFDGAATRAKRLRNTVAPEFVGLSGARRAFTEMSELVGKPADDRFAVTQVLGEGGMGVVHLAEQRSLGRKVVLKSLRSEVQSEENTLRLLQEAWVTGWIEHPNIVPVHDVTLDREGRPLIVLKRIEGETWSDLMCDPEAVRERFGAEDLLEWNLRLYMQVCNAIHFAHSRGILHRDLKPDNVMIGAFGEVYVVDWGIAVSLRDDAGGRLPAAAKVDGVAGTPCYMAPEMLLGDGSKLSEATDIYLLGAILHEILSGQPPHGGDTLPEVLRSISSGPSEPNGPRPLVDLCMRAMSQEPDGRPATAEAVRLEVQQYLRQRSVADLVVQAQSRCAQLVARAADIPLDNEQRTHRQALYELYSACKFAFHEALRVWPDGQDARQGLRAATTAMIEYELARREPALATPLLAEFVEPPAELVFRVEEASRNKAEADAHLQQLARMGQQVDPTIGQRTRTFIAVCLGSLFTVVPQIGQRVRYNYDEQSVRNGYLVLICGLLLIIGGFGYWARESMMKTAINRQVLATTVIAMVAQMVLVVALPVLEISIDTAEPLMLLVWSLISAMLAISVTPALFFSSFGYLIGFVVAAYVPEQIYTTMSLTNLVLTINLVWISAPKQKIEETRRGSA